MKAKIKFWQELQSDGSIADSWIRALSCLSFFLLCGYLAYSLILYKMLHLRYTDLLVAKNISEQTYITLTMQLKQVDELIFWVLILLTAAPKLIQKFAETRLGVKDTTESTTKTTSIETLNKTS